MRTPIQRVLIGIAAAAMTMPLYAAARLTYQLNNAPVPVAWAAKSFPIRYAVDGRIAANPQNLALVERAFNEWTTIPDVEVSFQDAGVVNGLKAGKDGINSVSLVDDLFQDQKFIALTTNWYDNNGTMIEADIQIDPAGLTSDYNSRLLVEHEVGHVLGLDHSGVLSSVMYPYVGRGGSAVLDSDDRIGIAMMYPKSDPTSGATVRGEVRGNEGGIFAAQVVAVNDRGEPVATALTNEQGEYELRGVPTGNYRIYAEPLDGPVDTRNLSGVWRQAKVESFPTQFVDGGAIHFESGKIYGNLIVNSTGAPVRLNPRFIGASPAGSGDFSLSSTPVSIKAGETMQLAVAGDGFTSGMTTFEVMSPGIRRISDFRYAANFAYATFSVAPDVPAGSAVILVKSGNETATLTGALRVEGTPRLRIAGR